MRFLVQVSGEAEIYARNEEDAVAQVRSWISKEIPEPADDDSLVRFELDPDGAKKIEESDEAD